MLEILQYATSSFWVFVACWFLIVGTGVAVSRIIRATIGRE